MSNQSFNNNDPSSTSAKRFITKESAQIEVYGRPGKIFCRLSNISQSGAYLEIINSTYLIRAKDLVRVTILLRQINKTHIVDAEIIWARGFGLGVNFLKKADLVTKISSRLSAA